MITITITHIPLQTPLHTYNHPYMRRLCSKNTGECVPPLAYSLQLRVHIHIQLQHTHYDYDYDYDYDYAHTQLHQYTPIP